jgi:outer membrane protein OmpA-like peptidoglycan-associated protein
MRYFALFLFLTPLFLQAQNIPENLRQEDIKPYLDSVGAERATETWDLRGVLFTMGTSYRMRNLPFEPGAHDLPADGVAALDSLADFLRLYPNIKLEIRVYFSPKLQEPPLRNLDKKRAAVIRDYLAGKGVDSDRLKATRGGYEAPIYPEELVDKLEDEDTRMRMYHANQRIDFYIAESPY